MENDFNNQPTGDTLPINDFNFSLPLKAFEYDEVSHHPATALDPKPALIKVIGELEPLNNDGRIKVLRTAAEYFGVMEDLKQ